MCVLLPSTEIDIEYLNNGCIRAWKIATDTHQLKYGPPPILIAEPAVATLFVACIPTDLSETNVSVVAEGRNPVMESYSVIPTIPTVPSRDARDRLRNLAS